MKVISVVGARPQFVKLAAIDRALLAAGHQHIIVHTGQHYDQDMSDDFFTDLGISVPQINLAVGSGSHATQTAAILVGLEEVFLQHQSDWVLVYGDTNSTLAGALAAVKIHQKIAHLEAGLRSFNRRMPEEHNRVLTDHASDILLAPTQTAMDHLKDEGLHNRAVLVGDVMVDVCLDAYQKGRSHILEELNLAPKSFIFATIHRPDNTDTAERLNEILSMLGGLDHPVLLAAHPRLRSKFEEFNVPKDLGNVRLIPPLGYPDLVQVLAHSYGVVTDSGGLQKEAFLLKAPCVTVRTETEWNETVELGVNLVSNNPSPKDVNNFIADAHTREWPTDMPYGDGQAAVHVVSALEKGL